MHEDTQVALADVNALQDIILEKLNTHLQSRGIKNPLVVGIHTGGVWLAEKLHQQLTAEKIVSDPLGTLDISFYRDDFTRAGLNPKVKPSELPVATEDRHVVLVDDVLMTGRTIRAAMNVLFEYGRPASITLVALIDLNAAELPIKADITGQQLNLENNQRVKLSGPGRLKLEIQTIPAQSS